MVTEPQQAITPTRLVPYIVNGIDTGVDVEEPIDAPLDPLQDGIESTPLPTAEDDEATDSAVTPDEDDTETNDAEVQAEADFGDFQNASQELTVSGVAEIIDGGAASEVTIRQMADRLSITPEEVQAKVERVHRQLSREANAEIAALGLPPAEVWRYALQHHPSAFREAKRRQITDGDLGGYLPIARDYLADLPDHRPELFPDGGSIGGAPISRRSDGRLTLKHPDYGEVGWREAVGMGLIDFS